MRSSSTSPRHIFTAVFCAALICAAGASAQDVYAPARVAAAAYSNLAVVHGVDALGVNPAQIVLPKGSTVSVSVLPFTFSAGMDFLSYETYQKFFVGVPNNGSRIPYYLSDADKAEVLGSFRGNDGSFYTNTSATLFAATVSTRAGSFGVSMRDRIAGTAILPRAMVEFLLDGNTPGRTFDFGSTRMTSSWTRDYAVTYAQRFAFTRQSAPAISFGASFKIVHGFGYFGLDRFNTSFTTDPDSFVVTGHAGMHARYAGTEWMEQGNVFAYSLFPTPAGSGFGLDLGFMADMTQSIRIAVAINDIGSVVWNRNAKETAADEDFTLNDLTTGDQFDAIREKMNGKERSIGSFTTPLPTAVTLSAAFTAHRFLGGAHPLVMTMALREGFNSVPGNSTVPHVSIGAEFEAIEQLPMRVGIGVGGNLPAMLAVGVGLRMDSFTLDVGTSSLDALFVTPHTSASFAVTGRLDF